MYDRTMNGMMAVVMVGCQMMDTVYQNMYTGSCLVWLGRTRFFPFESRTYIFYTFIEKQVLISPEAQIQTLYRLRVYSNIYHQALV